VEEIQLDRMSTAIGPRSNRIISRLSNIRGISEKKDTSHKDKEESLELKFEMDNLPIVDKTKGTSHYKKRVQQIIVNKR
jgi:hypothetical protein